MMGRLIIIWVIVPVAIFSSCATAPPQNQPAKMGPGRVHVSGNVTMTAVSR